MRPLSYFGSLICVGAGVYLLSFQSGKADPSIEGTSWLEIIAHGVGAYFIGKGLVLAAMTWAHFGSKECSHCKMGMPSRASVCGHCGRDFGRHLDNTDADKLRQRFEK